MPLKKQTDMPDDIGKLQVELRGTADALESGVFTREEAIHHIIHVLQQQDDVVSRTDGTASQGRVSFGRSMEDTPGQAIFWADDPLARPGSRGGEE